MVLRLECALDFILPRFRSWSGHLSAKVSVSVSRPQYQGLDLFLRHCSLVICCNACSTVSLQIFTDRFICRSRRLYLGATIKEMMTFVMDRRDALSVSAWKCWVTDSCRAGADGKMFDTAGHSTETIVDAHRIVSRISSLEFNQQLDNCPHRCNYV